MTMLNPAEPDPPLITTGTRCGLTPMRFGLLLLVVALGLWACWPRRAEIPNPDLSAAYAEVAQAIRESRADLETHTDSGAAWGDYGLVLGAHEFVAEARLCLSRAAELEPHDPRWPYFQGHLLQTREPLVAARAFEQTAARTTPQYAAFALSRAAETYLLADDLAAAQRAIEAALAANGDEPQAHYIAARVAVGRRDWKAALAAVERALTLRPQNRDVLELHSQVLRQLGERARADAVAAEANRLNDDSRNWPDPWLGDLHARRVDPHWRLHQALKAHAAKHSEHARELLFPVVVRHPEESEFALRLAAIEFETGHIDAAINVLQEALQRHPRSAELLALRGSCWLLKEDWPRAIDDLRNATTLSPQRSAYWVDLTFALRQTRDFVAAEAACEKALKLDQKSLTARIEQIYLQLALERFEEAQRLFAEHLEDKRNEPGVERLRGQLR